MTVDKAQATRDDMRAVARLALANGERPFVGYTQLTGWIASLAPAPDREGVRYGTMTIEQVPHWVKLDHAEYVRRREQEIDSALHGLKVHGGDWAKLAASMLHTAGMMSDEWGSYHHQCVIVAAALAARPTPAIKGDDTLSIRARALFADTFEKDGMPQTAERIRSGRTEWHTERMALLAIERALSTGEAG